MRERQRERERERQRQRERDKKGTGGASQRDISLRPIYSNLFTESNASMNLKRR